MINIFSVDVEDAMQAPSENIEDRNLFNYRGITKTINFILDLLNKANFKATFFISGVVAEKMPEVIREISNQGHEVASHGYRHKPVYRMTESEFENDLTKSLETLKVITGKRPIGYRAPYSSITRKSLWALNILRNNGIKYDASIYPTKNYLYGIPDFPRFPHYMKEYSIFEFPGSTVRIFGNNIPFGGGFYLRALPFWFTKLCIKATNRKGHPCSIYFHPHELGKDKYPLPFLHKENLILSFGRKNLICKIKSLLSENTFTNFKDYMEALPESRSRDGYSNNE